MAGPKVLKGREGLLLFLVPFLLALLLRLSLVREGLPFWYDEIWTANFAAFSMPWDRALDRLLREDSHPPLAYLLYRVWAELWGLKDPVVARNPGVEVGLRLLSALLGAGTAGLTGLLARSLGATFPLSLGAGVLYALAPIALTREAEVHVYPPAAFLTALALVFWAQRRPLPFALAALAAFHTHYLSLLLLFLPALSLAPVGLLPYALALPWLLLAVPRQGAGLEEKSPYNSLPEEALPQMMAFSHLAEPVLVGVGAGLWLLALLTALVPRGRWVGLTLLLYLLAWLVLLPAAFSFNSYSVRYTVLPLPLVLAGVALALSLVPIRAMGLSLLLPLVAWGLSLPLVEWVYSLWRSPPLLAQVLAERPGRVEAASVPLARVAKYMCRSCPVGVYGEGSLERLHGGGYLFTGTQSLGLLAGEDPHLLPFLRERGARVMSQTVILLIWVPGLEEGPAGGVEKPALPDPKGPGGQGE